MRLCFTTASVTLANVRQVFKLEREEYHSPALSLIRPNGRRHVRVHRDPLSDELKKLLQFVVPLELQDELDRVHVVVVGNVTSSAQAEVGLRLWREESNPDHDRVLSLALIRFVFNQELGLLAPAHNILNDGRVLGHLGPSEPTRESESETKFLCNLSVFYRILSFLESTN